MSIISMKISKTQEAMWCRGNIRMEERTMTRHKNHPRVPPRNEVSTMARGVAICVLEHSSLKWNGASSVNNVFGILMRTPRYVVESGVAMMLDVQPDMVQIAVRKDMRIAGKRSDVSVRSYVTSQCSRQVNSPIPSGQS